jgi:hypothetical protein
LKTEKYSTYEKEDIEISLMKCKLVSSRSVKKLKQQIKVNADPDSNPDPDLDPDPGF